MQSSFLGKVVTEKTSWRAVRHNAYTFQVPVKLTKAEIAKEVAKEFGVKVVAVRTMMRAPVEARFRNHRFSTAFKKFAIVSIAEGQAISIFE